MSMENAVAAVWHGPAEGFRLTELPLPALGLGEVLVETRAATLCGSDLHTVAGERETPVPTVLGHEMVGVVVDARGPVRTYDGREVVPGMRISWSVGAACGSCVRCRRGLPQKCRTLRKYGHEAITGDWQLSGGLASHCHLRPGTAIVAVPDALPDEVVAPANCATATIVSAARRVALTMVTPPDPRNGGEHVVIQGCGMLGLTAIAYVRSRGAGMITACDVAPVRRSWARRCGADAVTAPEDLHETVAELTGGEGAEVVLDLSGNSAAVRAALDLLAIGGRLGLVGSVFPSPAIEVDPEMIVRRLLTVAGIHNYGPGDLATAVDFLDRMADRDLFRGFVPETFPLAGIDDAVAHAGRERPPRVGIDPRIATPTPPTATGEDRDARR